MQIWFKTLPGNPSFACMVICWSVSVAHLFHNIICVSVRNWDRFNHTVILVFDTSYIVQNTAGTSPLVRDDDDKRSFHGPRELYGSK